MLISIITPTTPDRSHFKASLRAFVQSQDYPHIEHIIDEGPGTIGEKLNRSIQRSTGAIIVRFDDDDIYAHDYVSRCVEKLQYCDATGNKRAYFSDGDRAWLYDYKGSQPYFIGSGSAYHRHVWERNPYKPISVGEDTLFCANAGRILPINYTDGFIARIHIKNTASHNAIKYMKPVPMSELPQIKIPHHQGAGRLNNTNPLRFCR